MELFAFLHGILKRLALKLMNVKDFFSLFFFSSKIFSYFCCLYFFSPLCMDALSLTSHILSRRMLNVILKYLSLNKSQIFRYFIRFNSFFIILNPYNTPPFSSQLSFLHFSLTLKTNDF